MSRIVFTGGGTGGHVFPGLAVYEHLPPELQSRVLWIGSRRGVEREIVRRSGIPYAAIPTGKLRRYFDWENVSDVFRVGAGILAALRVLRSVEARAVFSKGGFVAVPVVVAARILRIPVVIHESDADPGLATRLTAPLADYICVPYEETARRFKGRLRRRIRVTGNPVRREFHEISQRSRALSLVNLVDDGTPVVLVTGGSLGASRLNELVQDTVRFLSEICIVVHQTGYHGETMINRLSTVARSGRYAGAPTFGREFAPLLHRADLVISRAGAGTIWELAVTGTPAILIPLTKGTSRGDQLRNARRYAETGAAEVINLDDPQARSVQALVRDLLQDPERLARMGDAARSFAHGKSAASIAVLIGHVLH
jgi:UDP-N-acetylglucosamine--N-acetylmuramyl-(pentapeptide) pyrophosphoryl-undecaprenol N-acetylglucosamine transferase